MEIAPIYISFAANAFSFATDLMLSAVNVVAVAPPTMDRNTATMDSATSIVDGTPSIMVSIVVLIWMLCLKYTQGTRPRIHVYTFVQNRFSVGSPVLPSFSTGSNRFSL